MLKQVKSGETPHQGKAPGKAYQDSQKFPFTNTAWKLVLVLLSLTFPCVVKAQVVEDNTLSNPTVVNIDGNLIEITGGTTAGSNLFHSFEEFSILSGETAWFNNLDSIANIISRVTGGSISNIDGLIRANGAANLFLLNPSGIVFGAGAQLDIGGSFFGSTADNIIFEDGTTFSATNPEEPPLLTISIPLGLQYGSNPGDIVVEGNGNNLLFLDGTPIIDRSNRPGGLQVNAGETLALVGGNISLDGGNLTATEGRIEIGSVTDESIVTLTPTNPGWILNYPEISNFGNINLTNAASLEVSGNGAGDVQLFGRNITVADGSAILANTQTDLAGGNITINATETLQVVGFAANNPFVSYVSTDVDVFAPGDGGDIDINTNSFLVAGGGQISSGTFGEGNGGTLRVQAQDIQIISGSFIGPSGLFAPVAPIATGNAGTIDVVTNTLLITDGARIEATTLGAGNAGNISVNATDIQVIGAFDTGFGVFSSSILAQVTSGSTGSGGNIEVTTDSLLISDGAAIDATTFGSGNAGNISVNATDIQLIGTLETDFGSSLSRIVAQVGSGATGSGGDIEVTTDSLLLLDGAQINSTTSSFGNGGNVNIQAQEVDLQGTSPSDVTSGLFSSILAGAEGDGGNVILETQNLRIADGAQVAISTNGSGNSGFLTVNATNIEIIGGTESVPSGLFSTVGLTTTGNGGELVIDTESLQIFDGAVISTNTFGSGNAGNLIINAQQIDLIGFSEQGRSGLFASAIADTGNGGTINVSTDQLSIQDGATISVSNFQSQNLQPEGTGAAGSLAITAEEIVLDTTDTSNPSTITASTFANGGGNIDIQVDSLTILNGSEITAETRGISNGGSISLDSDSLQLNSGARISTSTIAEGDGGIINITADNSNLDGSGTGIFSEAELDSSGNSGNINFTSDVLSLSNSSQISANTAGIGQAGSITLSGDFLEISSGSTITTSTNAEGDGGIINITADNSNLDGFGTGIFSEAEFGSSGDGGNIAFISDFLSVSNGAVISTNTSGSGDAGNLVVNAPQIDLIGFSEQGSSGLFASAVISSGNGGTINVNTDQLTLQDGATISVSNFSSQNFTTSETETTNDPEVSINEIVLDNNNTESNFSSTGVGGSITLQAVSIFLIPADSPGTGIAGSIQINADEIILDTEDTDNPSTITASTFSGGGGDIDLQIQESLLLRNGSEITAEARGSGNGGSVSLNSESFELNSGARISTSTIAEGDGGIINIIADNSNLDGSGTGIFSEAELDSSGDGGNVNFTSDSLSLSNDAQISANSAGNGQAGNINIFFDRLEANRGLITATSEETGGGDITLTTFASELILSNNSLISTSVQDSTGGGGDIVINADFIWARENSDIRANAVFGDGGNIQINTETIFLSPDSDINASSQFGIDGAVEINNVEIDKKLGVVELPETVVDPTQLVARTCPIEGDSFVVSGKGGLPLDPSENLRGESLWLDFRSFSRRQGEEKIQNSELEINNETEPPSVIIEAQGWIVNPQGNIELVAQAPETTPQTGWKSHPNCSDSSEPQS